jgi:hypothetical protein
VSEVPLDLALRGRGDVGRKRFLTDEDNAHTGVTRQRLGNRLSGAGLVSSRIADEDCRARSGKLRNAGDGPASDAGQLELPTSAIAPTPSQGEVSNHHPDGVMSAVRSATRTPSNTVGGR